MSLLNVSLYDVFLSKDTLSVPSENNLVSTCHCFCEHVIIYVKVNVHSTTHTNFVCTEQVTAHDLVLTNVIILYSI